MNRTYLLAGLMMFAGGVIGAWITRSITVPNAQAARVQAPHLDAQQADPADDGKTPAQSPESADEIEQLLAQANRGEALAWLADANAKRGVAQWSKNEVVELVNNFYFAGAPKVYVVDTETVDETEVASQFIIQLPSDPTVRERVFQVEADFEAEYNDPPTQDIGQKYLHITTD